MKIYFAGSIRGGRQLQSLYFELIDRLKIYGEVLTEHVGDQDLLEAGEAQKSDAEIFSRDIEWLSQADVMVAEVTVISLGVGYELGIAEKLGIPVLCLYRDQNLQSLSAMITGNPAMTIYSYSNVEEADQCFKDFFPKL